MVEVKEQNTYYSVEKKYDLFKKNNLKNSGVLPKYCKYNKLLFGDVD